MITNRIRAKRARSPLLLLLVVSLAPGVVSAGPTATVTGRVSEAQEILLARCFKAAWLMLDGDEPGQHAAAELLARLSRRMWVRAAVVPDGSQPDQLTGEQMKQLLPPL